MKDNTGTEQKRRDIHAPSKIRTHDPCVWEGETISFPRKRARPVCPLCPVAEDNKTTMNHLFA
jgi:RNA polymerase-binding transcription factor DksA